MSLHLSIRVLESDVPNEGLVLFDGGTERGTAPRVQRPIARSNKTQISVVLEVHDGGRKNNILHITEVMVRPASAGPEWIELHNPNDFAIALKGWSFNHTSGLDVKQPLAAERRGVRPIPSVLTGDPSRKRWATPPMSSTSVRSASLALASSTDWPTAVDCRPSLHPTDEITPADVVRVEWGQHPVVHGDRQSLVWDGTDRFSSSAWSLEDAPSPGDYEA